MEIFCPPGCLSGSLGQDSTMPRICSGLRKDNRATITHWKTYFWILRSCRHPDHSAIALYYTTERFGASGVLLSLNFWSSASIFSSSGKGDHFWPAEGACQRGCSSLEKVQGIRWFYCPAEKKTTSIIIITIVITTTIIRVGVSVGDRVAGYIPNCPEAIIAMAATASLGGSWKSLPPRSSLASFWFSGAVWSSTSPDFGVSGVLDRFSQIEPKVRGADADVICWWPHWFFEGKN